MAELAESYPDLPLGIVDAVVVAIAEHLALTEIATLAVCRLNSDLLMTGGQRVELERLARSHTAPARRQAKALLSAGSG